MVNDHGQFREFVTDPARLERELLAAPPATRTILLDEVQRIPALLDGVQVIIDAHPRRFRFLLSGSSARKLRRGQANLLPGRLVLHHLHPLVASEIGADFDLTRVLAHGTLPGIYADCDPESRAATLRSYVDAYLREEVQAEALVRDIGGYARLLDLAAASSGRVVNLHALSRAATPVSPTIHKRHRGSVNPSEELDMTLTSTEYFSCQDLSQKVKCTAPRPGPI